MVDISLEKTLPTNLEAERSILGAILLEDTALLTIFETLKSQDFYLDGHRKIFEKMLHLMNNSRPIDLVTLKDELQRANELETVGGAAYLAGLTDGLPRAINIEYYAQIVKEKSTLRRLIQISNETMVRSYQDEDPAEDLDGDGKIRQMPKARESFFHIPDSPHCCVIKVSTQIKRDPV